MSTILSKLWPGLALAIIALLAFLLLKGGCNKPVIADQTAAQMASIKSGYDSAVKLYQPQIDSLAVQKDSLTDIVDDLRSQQYIMQYQLDLKGDSIQSTLATLDQVKVSRDTVRILANCDSLESEIRRGIPSVQAYAQLTDSIINASMAKGVIQDSMIAKLTRINKLGDSTITAQQLQFDLIHKDDMSKTTQLKVYRPVAIGGVALAAIIIVLKFILH